VPKWAAYAVAWALAAAAALAVAWQGVGVVTNQVTEDRPAALSAAEVRDRLDETTTSTTSTTTTTAVTTTTTITAGGSAATTSPTSVPGGSPATTSVPTTTATTAPATATTATTTAPPGPSEETRTYNLVGGSVSLRFAPSGVTVVWANPNAGFDVSQEPEQLNGVKVEFRSETHRSRVDGWWDGGPQDRVREEPDS
jgi:hypothetical protein